jgi:Rrf2 family protein
MVHLASLPEGSRASLGTLAASVDVPATFLSKVLQRLVKAGLVVSWRGKKGGFELARNLASVSLLDVLNALDGVPALNTCLGGQGCTRSVTCGAHMVWLEAQERLREVLAGASLERVARITRARQRLAGARGRTGPPVAH